MSELTPTVALEDVKSVIILAACDIAESLNKRGDAAGAYALVTLVKTIEDIPIATRADLPPTLSAAMQLPEVVALVEALQPLAVMADRYEPDDGDGNLECWSGLAVPKIHHLRTARAALAAIKETKP